MCIHPFKPFMSIISTLRRKRQVRVHVTLAVEEVPWQKNVIFTGIHLDR